VAEAFPVVHEVSVVEDARTPVGPAMAEATVEATIAAADSILAWVMLRSRLPAASMTGQAIGTPAATDDDGGQAIVMSGLPLL
jgi:hypothetical protein